MIKNTNYSIIEVISKNTEYKKHIMIKALYDPVCSYFPTRSIKKALKMYRIMYELKNKKITILEIKG